MRGRHVGCHGMLPLEPVDRLLVSRECTVHELPEHLERNYYRSRIRGGYTYYAADSIAIWFGLHPVQVWGWTWFGEDTETETAV